MSRTGLSTMRSWLSPIFFMARMLEYSLMGFTSMSMCELEFTKQPIHFCNARMRFFISFFLAIRWFVYSHFESFGSLSASLQEVRQFFLSVCGSSLCCDYIVYSYTSSG